MPSAKCNPLESIYFSSTILYKVPKFFVQNNFLLRSSKTICNSEFLYNKNKVTKLFRKHNHCQRNKYKYKYLWGKRLEPFILEQLISIALIHGFFKCYWINGLLVFRNKGTDHQKAVLIQQIFEYLLWARHCTGLSSLPIHMLKS